MTSRVTTRECGVRIDEWDEADSSSPWSFVIDVRANVRVSGLYDTARVRVGLYSVRQYLSTSGTTTTTTEVRRRVLADYGSFRTG